MAYAAVAHPITGEPVRANVIEEIGGPPPTHYVIEYAEGGTETIAAERLLDLDYETYMATYSPDPVDVKTDEEKALDFTPEADANRLKTRVSYVGQ